MTAPGLTPLERRVLVALRAAPGFLNDKELADILYGDLEQGGPLQVNNNVRQYVWMLRAKRGLTIEGRHGFGWRLTSADRAILNARWALRTQGGSRMTSSTEIVQDVVAEYFRMTREQLLAPCRRRDVAWPRQLAMSLTVELLPLSFPATGAHFGNRHHTTVMHACGQVRRQIAQGGRGAERDLALLRVECLRRLDASREKLHGQEAEHEAA